MSMDTLVTNTPAQARQSTRVLLAVDGDDQEVVYKELIRRLDKDEHVQLQRVSFSSKALDALQSGIYDLVICGWRLAPSSSEAADDGGGLRLCQQIHELQSPDQKKKRAQLALVVPSKSRVIEDLSTRLQPAPWLFTEDQLNTDLYSSVVEMQRPAKRLDIVITTQAEGDWVYALHGVNFDEPFHPGGQLRLGRALPSGWQDASSDMGPKIEQAWIERFQRLGRNILQGIVELNPLFASQLSTGLRIAGGVDRSRVTFFVGDGHYQMALESIFAPEFEQGDEQPMPVVKSPKFQALAPWIVKAPLFRAMNEKDGIPSCQLSLAVPLRSLIVCADTSGRVKLPSGNSLRLSRLKHIRGECNTLSNVLDQAKKSYLAGVKAIQDLDNSLDARRAGMEGRFVPVDEPVVLGLEGPVTRAAFLAALGRKQDWHIVHFAGHSHFEPGPDGQPGKGYLFLGEPNAPEAVDISELVPELRRSKLLYLSSCHGANASFVVQAADSGVPSVIGFRTLVGDEPAKTYAFTFYSNLLGQRAVDVAFLEARRKMYMRNPSDGTWASAMLIMGRGKL